MTDISVVVCTHNPRRHYLQRVLRALEGQTLSRDRWELLVVDNASREPLAGYDLSWHRRAGLVREDRLGLTAARLRGITEATGELVVFVDDDNVLARDFLERASEVCRNYPFLGAFGAGRLEPEFEIEPSAALRPHLQLLALRSVPAARWSNNPRDHESIPWGAGLCVHRRVAHQYLRVVEGLAAVSVLDRTGTRLFSGGDDLFAWVAASAGYGFGIFPELFVTHLIAAGRLNERYFLQLIHDHAYSGGILHYVLAGVAPRRIHWTRYVHAVLHGLRNGRFSMRCRWAEWRGADGAARAVLERRWQPAQLARLREGDC
jgi:glycosyltransferase involved in cell wall biosynthesis